MKEIDPVCVLDFYVHESCQRQGIGNKLFEFMCQVSTGELLCASDVMEFNRPRPDVCVMAD